MIEVHFAEYINDWRTGKDNLYKRYAVTGGTETECFKKIYTGYIRPSRYCNDRVYKLDDMEQQKRFQDWKQHGITIEMFYGNGTVD